MVEKIYILNDTGEVIDIVKNKSDYFFEKKQITIYHLSDIILYWYSIAKN